MMAIYRRHPVETDVIECLVKQALFFARGIIIYRLAFGFLILSLKERITNTVIDNSCNYSSKLYSTAAISALV